MKKSTKEDIHKIVLEKFGTNKLYDEEFTQKTYWEALPGSSEDGLIEPMAANPDILSDTATPWKKNRPATTAKALAVRQALKRLTERERQVVVMLAEGLTQKEVAENLEIQPGSVGVFLERAKVKIKKYLSSKRSF